MRGHAGSFTAASRTSPFRPPGDLARGHLVDPRAAGIDAGSAVYEAANKFVVPAEAPDVALHDVQPDVDAVGAVGAGDTEDGFGGPALEVLHVRELAGEGLFPAAVQTIVTSTLPIGVPRTNEKKS